MEKGAQYTPPTKKILGALVISHHVYEHDVALEVGVALGVGDHARRDRLTSDLNVASRLVDGHQLEALQLSHAPEEDLQRVKKRRKF